MKKNKTIIMWCYKRVVNVQIKIESSYFDNVTKIIVLILIPVYQKYVESFWINTECLGLYKLNAKSVNQRLRRYYIIIKPNKLCP